MRRRIGEVDVRWVRGGLYLETDGYGLLLDVPVGAALELSDVLDRIECIAISSGRAASVGGLIPLLCALERPRAGLERPLSLRSPIGVDRPAQLASAWMHAWPQRYRLSVDAEQPGATLELGPFRVETLSVRHGEPRWTADGADVVPAAAVVLVVQGPGARVAWVPGAAPSPGWWRRAVRDVDLAVVEVGRAPWPATTERWRLSVDDVVRAAQRVEELWLVGDDGHPVDTAEA